MLLEREAQSVIDTIFYLKHLPGKHNQLDHGRRFGKPNKNPQWEKMSEKERHHDMLSKYSEWKNGLTKDEKLGIETYTSSSYKTMNDHLRNGNKVTKVIKERIKNAQAGLEKGNAPYNFTVTRGVGISGEEGDKFFAMFEKGKGKTFTDPAFISTSTDASGFSGNIQFKIHVPKGAKGAYVGGVSVVPGEHEFLLPPGTKFKVLSTSVNSYGEKQVEIGVASR